MNVENQGSDVRNSYLPQTVSKAFSVLDCFSLQEPELTSLEFSERLHMSPSTIYRYLSALENGGFIERNSATGKYSVGFRVIELAGIALMQSEISRHGAITIDKLANCLDINASLGVLHQGDAFHLAFSVRNETDRMNAAIGRRKPAHCTGLGKAMLAYLPDNQVHQLISDYKWRPQSPNSIRDFESLKIELNQVRRQGYAIDRGEVNEWSWCVAAPVFAHGANVVAAIGVNSNRERIESEFKTIVRQVRRHADQLSMRLGYLRQG